MRIGTRGIGGISLIGLRVYDRRYHGRDPWFAPGSGRDRLVRRHQVNEQLQPHRARRLDERIIPGSKRQLVHRRRAVPLVHRPQGPQPRRPLRAREHLWPFRPRECPALSSSPRRCAGSTHQVSQPPDDSSASPRASSFRRVAAADRPALGDAQSPPGKPRPPPDSALESPGDTSYRAGLLRDRPRERTPPW